MSGLRGLVQGGASCSADGGRGPAGVNPAASLADALLGGNAAKGHESLRELPGKLLQRAIHGQNLTLAPRA